MRRFYSFLLCSFFLYAASYGQGAIVNEISNGPAGSQEFIELVVIGPAGQENCGPVDLRGFIVDDNNGDFSCGPRTSRGIATGHVKFDSVAIWEAVPTGSIIVIYNGAEPNVLLPADDPDDTVNPDGVFILPTTDPSILVTTGTGCATGQIPTGTGATCPGTGVSSYAGACYTAGGSYDRIGLRNSGDASQVRNPDGSYFHGFSYGSNTEMNGGPDVIHFTGSGTGDYYYFDNTVSDDYRDANNFAMNTVLLGLETPGQPNSVANATWIANLGLPCALPVIYGEELQALPVPDGNLLEWTTVLEINSDHFVVERSDAPDGLFTELGEVKANGDSHTRQEYSFLDAAPLNGRNYYRLLQVDVDGTLSSSPIVEVMAYEEAGFSLRAWPNPSSSDFHVEVRGAQVSEVLLQDQLGRTVIHQHVQGEQGQYHGVLPISQLPAGSYFLRVRTDKGWKAERLQKI